MSENTIFRVENLEFGYGGPPVLTVGELEFEKNRIHVLLGPNGSGKTSLLKLLNRLLYAQKGNILLEGKDIGENRAVREETVYLHQNPLLFSGMVYNNIAYGLKIRKMPKVQIAERVNEALTVAGLEGFEKRRHNALSGGEIQRVAIARALVLRPKVILFDEPTSSIDLENVRRFEKLLPSIRDRYGTTIIVSTHNLPFAYRICDRLVHLDEGKVVPTGENILSGSMVSGERDERLFECGGVRIHCPDMDGDFVKAVVDHDRIVLSRETLHSSARNNFAAEVKAVTPMQIRGQAHPLMDVTLAVKDLRLTSRITEQSCKELGLDTGSMVFASFKASTVRLY
ncbi:ATP-binding cassette domain-containing protein [Marispirochaeta sp.]|jgi:molybdopterin-binding protein|uniref:ATP-binding cassette domain-containing protein n=1 Tax=Marispirochaeta sp. TaxID=2038653 RepID=UPI0029C8691F|nr:ATP-binding cassette domain-containing protein [Marispirochaeta sp.]